jgi:hypothetical protein
MTVKAFALTALSCYLISGMVDGQSSPVNSKNFFHNLKVSKGFQSQDDKSEPAVFSITLPAKGENSYLVNTGIAYDLVRITHAGTDNVKTTFSPFVEYNRNTLIDKEQNSYTVGIANNYILGKYTAAQRKVRYFFLDNALSYQRNRADTTHSLIITSYATMVRSGISDAIWLQTPKTVYKGLSYFLSVSAGPEYQYRFEGPDSLKGGIGRIFYTVEGRLLQKLHGELGDPFVELRISNTGRYDVLNSSDTKEGYLPLFVPELLIYPSLTYNFSIGFSYNAGSDPIAGLRDQRFFLFVVNFKW